VVSQNSDVPRYPVQVTVACPCSRWVALKPLQPVTDCANHDPVERRAIRMNSR
jgi:hypothetical protein